jgi:hypothetical protein
MEEIVTNGLPSGNDPVFFSLSALTGDDVGGGLVAH